MPRNGSGQYSLPSGINPVITQTLITSNWANTTLSDVAAAITQSLSRDGQALPTANLPMGGFRHTNVADPVLRDNYATLGYVQDGSHYQLVSVAGNNAISAVLPGGLSAYSLGMLIQLQPVATSTGPVTLNVNGVGAVPVVTTAGNQLGAGDLLNGKAYMLMYNGSAFEMITGGDTSTIAQATISGAVRPGSGNYPLVTQFDPTTVTVPGGTGFIVEPSARDSTDVIEVTWATQNVVLTNLTQWVTYIAVDAGGTIVQLTGNALPSAARSNIILAVVSHINGQITGISNRPSIYGDMTYTAFDLSMVFNNILLSGGRITPNAGNPMHMDLAAGVVWRMGGFANQINGPNITPFLGQTDFSFFPVTGSSAVGALTQTAPITNYDPAGAGAVVAIPGPANTTVIHRIYSVAGQLIWLYGQITYADLNTAIREMALDTANLKTPANLVNATLLCLVIATKATLNLGDTLNCRLVPQGGTSYSIGVAGSISEAPIDGSSYGRKNAAWSKVVDAVISGDGISVNSADPNKPIVSLGATFAGPKTLTSGNFLFSATSDIRFSKTTFGIGALSIDGADNQFMQLYSGGAPDVLRGAFLELFGNEAGVPGQVRLWSGGGAPVFLNGGPVVISDGDLRITSAAATVGIEATSIDFQIRGITVDGADNQRIGIMSAPVNAATRGAAMFVHGNEHASQPGVVVISSGSPGGVPAAIRLDNGDVRIGGGRLFGTALHNNAGGMAGATNQFVGSGTYTPTFTPGANVTGGNPQIAQFMRVGNVVTVCGRVDALTTTAGAGTLSGFSLSLPIASAIDTFTRVGGTAVSGGTTVNEPCTCTADATNDRASFGFYSQQTAGRPFTYQFSYLVI